MVTLGTKVSVGHSFPGQQTLEGVEEVEEAKVRVPPIVVTLGTKVSLGHSCPGQQTLEGVAVEEVEEAKVRVANGLWKWTS